MDARATPMRLRDGEGVDWGMIFFSEVVGNPIPMQVNTSDS
jgi:hypothetical protein